jgi:Protein of unknown function (DUF2934)
MAKTPTSNGKLSKNKAPAASSDPSPIQLSGRPDGRQIRERTYGIWIEEGRPHGREQAHWRRASPALQGWAR